MGLSESQDEATTRRRSESVRFEVGCMVAFIGCMTVQPSLVHTLTGWIRMAGCYSRLAVFLMLLLLLLLLLFLLPLVLLYLVQRLPV